MKPAPVACSLTAAELREREASLLARLRSGVTAIEELPDGYAFTFEGDGKWLVRAAEAVAAERDCCPFLTFEAVAQPDHGPLIVRITGPEGSKEFLRTILGEPGRTPWESPLPENRWVNGYPCSPLTGSCVLPTKYAERKSRGRVL